MTSVEATTEVAHCSSCQAEIRWVATKNAKPQPINAEPDGKGNIRFLEPAVYRATVRGALRAIEVIPKAELAAEMFPDGRDRYMPHHATCPDVDQYRRHHRPKA